MAITCEVLRDPAQLATLDSAWRELLQRSDTNEPALAPFWLRAWWRVFGEQGGRTLRVLSMFDGDRLIGLVPLLARRHWYRHGLPFRRLELLGSGEDEEDEICSEYLGVVAERGREAEVTAELANALAKLRLGEWDEVVFPSMRGESRAARMLLEALERAGLAVEASVTADCPYIALPATFDDYLARLSSSNRQFVKRSVSSFEAWAQDDVQWPVASGSVQGLRFSPLTEIRADNVAKLQVAFTFSTGIDKGQEAAPIVVDGTMVIVTPWPNMVYALDLTKPGAP